MLFDLPARREDANATIASQLLSSRSSVAALWGRRVRSQPVISLVERTNV